MNKTPGTIIYVPRDGVHRYIRMYFHHKTYNLRRGIRYIVDENGFPKRAQGANLPTL